MQRMDTARILFMASGHLLRAPLDFAVPGTRDNLSRWQYLAGEESRPASLVDGPTLGMKVADSSCPLASSANHCPYLPH
jgi:hypothetical protein